MFHGEISPQATENLTSSRRQTARTSLIISFAHKADTAPKAIHAGRHRIHGLVRTQDLQVASLTAPRMDPPLAPLNGGANPTICNNLMSEK